MLYSCHRINTVQQLLSIPSHYGIELDLRDTIDGHIHISHDPFIQGELFENFLNYYHHAFIILNIKSERIEYKVLELVKLRNIKHYFL